MAHDTLAKLRALISMKSTLIKVFQDDLDLARQLVEALRQDLAHAVNLIAAKDDHIKRLQDENYRLMMKDWEQQDKDEEWLADYLANHDPIELDIMAQPADSTLNEPLVAKFKDFHTFDYEDWKDADYPVFGDDARIDEDGFETLYPTHKETNS